MKTLNFFSFGIKLKIPPYFRTYDPAFNSPLYGYPNNYFNYYNIPGTYILTGTVVDGNNNNVPIKNAVILAWHTVTCLNGDVLWEDFYFTYTKDDGTFELKADKSIDIVWVAFIGKETEQRDSSRIIQINSQNFTLDNIVILFDVSNTPISLN
jgi:hypothetical protein